MYNLPDGIINFCWLFCIQTSATQSEEKMDVDQSPSRGKDDKMDEEPSQTQSMLDQTVERHSKEIRKAASVETAKVQTQV